MVAGRKDSAGRVEYTTPQAAPHLRGKVVVITGATSGVGGGLLRATAQAGASHVYVLCRSMARGAAAKEKALAQAGEHACAPEAIELVSADLASMSSVRDAAAAITAAARPIDVMFLNAATLPTSPSAGSKTKEGLEEAYAVNVCAMHLLARQLVPKLAPAARIIITGSDAAGLSKVNGVPWKLDLEALTTGVRLGAGGFNQYARTKLAVHMFASELSKRLGEKASLLVFHPGAIASSLGNNVAPRLARVVKPILGLFFRSPETGAKFGVHAASVEAPLAGYLEDGNFGQPRNYKAKPIRGGEDAEANLRLWEATEASLMTVIGPLEALPRAGDEGAVGPI